MELKEITITHLRKDVDIDIPLGRGNQMFKKYPHFLKSGKCLLTPCFYSFFVCDIGGGHEEPAGIIFSEDQLLVCDSSY